jgi:acyl-CoA dehydrogenase
MSAAALDRGVLEHKATSATALAQVVAVARSYADAVDTEGRFPTEAIGAMREAGLLGALVPTALGGPGQTVSQVAAACYAIGKACASSAMILAMHHIQLACLVDHATDSPWHQDFLSRVMKEGLLLASVTSEAGVGGSMRTSLCALQPGATADDFVLDKRATAISYGGYADALLVTTRAHAEAEASDQVLVVVPTAGAAMERTGGWNAMGMRGTCSEAFHLQATGSRAQVIPVAFSRISAETMVPVSHLLWASLWTGIAADAVMRARAFLRQAMRKAPGGSIPPGASRLVGAVERLQMVEARVNAALAHHATATPEQAESFAVAAATNMLKTGASEICLEVVQEALLVCGFSGYSNVGPFSLSRHLRDLNSARLMINNDRIRDNTARLLLLQPPQLGIG